jgi:hypothetical protein
MHNMRGNRAFAFPFTEARPSNLCYPWCLRWSLLRDTRLSPGIRANRWGTSNSKPLGLIIMMGQSKILSSCQMLFISLLYRVTQILRLLPVMASCAIMLIENNFPEPNWHILSFLHPILLRRITYWAPLEMLLERGPCIYTYKQGCKSIHKSTKNVDANVNTQKENQDNQNRSNEVEDVML